MPSDVHFRVAARRLKRAELVLHFVIVNLVNAVETMLHPFRQFRFDLQQQKT